jgi:hypothetical protein
LLGFSLRPEGSAGFDDENGAGTRLGMSAQLELNREFAAALEIDRVALGRGTALTGFDSLSADYAVTSAMLGLRAYPYKTKYLDLFVAVQVGAGVQSVSAVGTRRGSTVASAIDVFECDASDTPAFQIGGVLGARWMLTSRVGVSARIDGVGRRLSGDVIEACAPGLGGVTSVGAALGVGYDFELGQ